MSLFRGYMKHRCRDMIAGMLFFCIFFVSFYLYHLPLAAVLYPALLCLFIGAFCLMADYGRMKKKHLMLEQIRSIADLTMDLLPEAEGLNDTEYCELILRFKEEYNTFRTTTNKKYADMMDYYSVWVHQIKTPIASMRLHLQNEDSALSRKLSMDLFRIEQYVDMVMTFLRLDAGSTDYVFKEYDLDRIVRQAVKRFAGEFIERKLSLVYMSLNVAVVTDEKWLFFVVEQVLSNALKYTQSGSITITWEDDEYLCIKDTGIGIAPEDLPRIFENGYTGYNGRADKKASGIGLYLCKRICDNLGHEITAESKPDRGTVVKIKLVRDKLEIE